jgi:hypothetical protein
VTAWVEAAETRLQRGVELDPNLAAAHPAYERMPEGMIGWKQPKGSSDERWNLIRQRSRSVLLTLHRL